MISFKIEDKEYQIPNIISIELYSKIYKIKDLFSDDYFAAKLVSTVCGPSVEELLESDFQEVNYIATYIMSLLPQAKPAFVDRFEIDGVKYGFFPKWRDLTFAEFVDMDTLSTKKPEEVLDYLHIIAAIMYRPITEEKSEHDFKIEKYDVKTMQERAELFKKKLDVTYILGAQFFFYQVRKEIFRLFPAVFDPEAIDMDENENRMDDEEADMDNSFQKVYGWFLVTNRLTNNDITKHEAVYQKNITEVLNQLSFLIEYDREQTRMQNKAMRRS